jgi:putative component of membrane protein insertase Oxa1/YidC/SpoIIIJ protein YidD
LSLEARGGIPGEATGCFDPRAEAELPVERTLAQVELLIAATETVFEHSCRQDASCSAWLEAAVVAHAQAEDTSSAVKIVGKCYRPASNGEQANVGHPSLDGSAMDLA